MIKPQVGKTYRCKNGAKVEIEGYDPLTKVYSGSIDEVRWNWTQAGECIHFDDIYDLVAEWGEDEKPQFKVGDKVRVDPSIIPTEERRHRCLFTDAGTVVSITDYSGLVVVRYGYDNFHIPAEYLTHTTTVSGNTKTCTCDLHALMRSGCQCGGFAAEQARSQA